MTLAIRSGRASCLSLQLAPGTWLLAVARGFGRIDGLPTEYALLSRLRHECARRLRKPGFRRAVERPQAAATAILALLGRVNAALYTATASHDDYVTAAASLTAAIVVGRFVYVMHAGATGAYLVRSNEVVSLCPDDAIDERGITVLACAFAAAPAVDISVSNVRLEPGDAIVLLGRRIGGSGVREAVLECLSSSEPAEQILVARFDEDTAAAAGPARAVRTAANVWPLLTTVLALVALLAALVLAR